MSCERGQATIEWAGLVLLVALALAGLAGLARVVPVGGRGLGVAVAERIGCAVRDGCAEAGGAGPRGAEPLARPPAVAPPARAPRPEPPASAPAPEPPAPPDPEVGAVLPPGIPRELAERFPRLARVVDLVGRKAWIACFGWESFRYDLEHRARVNPNLTMSPRDAAGIANTCLNPYSFFPG